MRRRRATPEPPWALLSFLLRYPDESVVRSRAELAAEVAALPDGPVRDALGRFMDGWTADPAVFVETFDLRRRASLYLTYYAHGDTRERGMALLRLKKLYRADGLPRSCSASRSSSRAGRCSASSASPCPAGASAAKASMIARWSGSSVLFIGSPPAR